ncbi:MAG: tol-pal system protein YbgF [Gammaproteobacteria bacterium]|nr:tol-pal system protein YbgF [Gammaproteobacteria bacterium]NNF61543.1 tol-pal system protein YbgF [Gammaproteobacteria bacterium]NNM19905.1 tol-pal system protein YbgF [Gammaproteobacteria bacterium]
MQVERVMENQSLISLLTELQQVTAELAELRNEVETLKFESEGARNRQRDLYVDIDGRLNALESGAAGGLAAPVTSDGGNAATQAVSDRDAYKAAFGLLEEGRYDEAGTAFAEFVARYPQSSLVDNAQYWFAEALYVERQFSKALTEFQRVVSEYPDSRKIPDALLKIGYSHYELKKYADSRAALERVVAEHPDSTAARLARQRLERMSGEGR